MKIHKFHQLLKRNDKVNDRCSKITNLDFRKMRRLYRQFCEEDLESEDLYDFFIHFNTKIEIFKKLRE